METLISFVVNGGVLSLADQNIVRSIVKMKEDQDKILALDNFKLLSAAGEAGDCAQFTEYISKNLKLYSLRNGYDLSTTAAANFIRSELAASIRSHPYSVNLILAGYDKTDGPSVFYLDYMGSLQKLNFGCHGYAAYFLLGLLDRHHQPNLSLEDGVKLMKMCVTELQTRFLVNGKYKLKFVSKDGITEIPFTL
ncbi:proteasome subunit beta type 2 [Tieghemostelium lacteum]|uniref:Proteasome subunit beta n=1 Tax=Tieghemostelium lacteum TaxID=361077 RepID=A0A151ZSB4_TIELA|nr:proteasome subunit beta type 2 [Tieghemostelium lacteum]|eukprot:KYQ96832.1 proteasome subunit beta type 2 [Tieghemostelium lacteum]